MALCVFVTACHSRRPGDAARVMWMWEVRVDDQTETLLRRAEAAEERARALEACLRAALDGTWNSAASEGPDPDRAGSMAGAQEYASQDAEVGIDCDYTSGPVAVRFTALPFHRKRQGEAPVKREDAAWYVDACRLLGVARG